MSCTRVVFQVTVVLSGTLLMQYSAAIKPSTCSSNAHPSSTTSFVLSKQPSAISHGKISHNEEFQAAV